LVKNDGFWGGGWGAVTNGQATIYNVSGNDVSLPLIPVGGLLYGTALWTFDGAYAFSYALAPLASSSLINLSTRGWIGAGQRLIAGTVIDRGPKRLLIRAVGPTLGGFGVDTAHPDPRISLYQGQTLLAANDNWNGQGIIDSAAYAGGFPLSSGSKDACLLLTVEPGAYTVIVEGDGALGEAIIEIYEIK
jgi:hypothetical protein